jgi:hypothetical protein
MLLKEKDDCAARAVGGLLKTHLTRFAIWALPEPCRALFRVWSVQRREESGGDDEPKSWRVVPRYERTRLPSNETTTGGWRGL